jgi:hypothetical protein
MIWLSGATPASAVCLAEGTILKCCEGCRLLNRYFGRANLSIRLDVKVRTEIRRSVPALLGPSSLPVVFRALGGAVMPTVEDRQEDR